MVIRTSGYSKVITAKTDDSGNVITNTTETYYPDMDTEILKGNTSVLRDLTDKELNEIMDEIESPKEIVDTYPLKNIRKAAFEA